MQTAENIDEEPELATVDGIGFKPYQIEWIEIMAKLDGLSMNEWVERKILCILESHLETFTDYTGPVCERLKADLRG